MSEAAAKKANTEHYTALERMYLSAPINSFYSPEIWISHGEAEIAIPVKPEFFHAAAAVHGSVYFKLLDDAAFFAANSLIDEHFGAHRELHDVPAPSDLRGQNEGDRKSSLCRRALVPG